MSPEPILLDLDGTLVDSLADIGASANHVRAHVGLDPVPLESVRTMIGDGARKLLERAIAGADGDPTVDDVWSIYLEHHATQCTELVRPYPGTVEQLAHWREHGSPLAVVTNKPEGFTHRILAHLQLDAFFGAVVAGDTTSERKPSPIPVLEALRRLAVPAGRGLMVGDGVQDLRAGKSAGLRTAAVLFGFRDEAVLRAERDR